MHTFVQLMHTCFAMECRTKLSSICALTNSDSSFHGNPIFVMLCRMFPTSLHIHRIRIPYPSYPYASYPYASVGDENQRRVGHESSVQR